MTITLRHAIDNYRDERRRLEGGIYPHVACSCGFCDVVRAADLLYAKAAAQVKKPRWQPPIGRRQ